MGDKAEGTASANGEEEEWGQESDARIQMIIRRWQGRSQKGSVGPGDDGEDNDWGYDQVPSECKRDIDKRGSDSDNGLGDDKSGMPDGNADEWKGEEPGSYLLSTKTRLAEERVLHRIPGGRTRLGCW